MTSIHASKLEGPIPATSASAPFHGVATDPVPGPGLPPLPLASAGFVEEEYFVSGEHDGFPYRTSLLIRKPADPAAFSGVVIVETLHAAGAVPMSAYHIALKEHGHGYAMVASQKVALDAHMKRSDPERYATLDISELGASADEPTDHGDPMAAQRLAIERQTPMSNTILSQVGALLKGNSASGPFAPHEVKYLIMGGCSQTGGTTLRYIRDAHAGARMPDGSAIYDGYFPALAGGTEPVGPRDVPVIHALNEGDIMGGRPLGYRRPNSDAPDDRFRLYEVVGSSHVPTRGMRSAADIFPTLANATEADKHLSQFPSPMIFFPALHNLIEWVTHGVAPPRAEPIETDLDGGIVRDRHGNACGGVRLSYIDVPFATFVASTAGSDMYQRMIGQQHSLPKSELAALYPSHEQYVAEVKARLEGLEADRWIFPADADQLIAEAEAAAVP